MHASLAEKGLRILGFPCNQFGGQVTEPGIGLLWFIGRLSHQHGIVNYVLTFDQEFYILVRPSY